MEVRSPILQVGLRNATQLGEMITSLWVTACRLKCDRRAFRGIITVFLANCQVTAIAFSDEVRSPQLSIC